MVAIIRPPSSPPRPAAQPQQPSIFSTNNPKFAANAVYPAAVTGGGGGGEGGGEFDFNMWLWELQERRRVDNVVTTLRGVMKDYGLETLMSSIEGWVRSGLDGEAVMAMVRESNEYAQRFPAMKALRQKMRAISEAAYIDFERSAAGLERQYGLPAGMLGKDAVTRLLTAEVSERELEQRVVMASAAAYQVGDDVRQQFRDYYGIEAGGLAAYFLDAERATPLLNKQYVAAQIGAEAGRQAFRLDTEFAEELQMAGIDREGAREGFSTAASRRGLTAGRGDVASETDVVRGTLLNEQQAQEKMQRAGLARRGRFESGGGYQATQTGVSALGSSTST